MRKIVGIVAAVLLAVIGAGLLAGYVQSAREEIRKEEAVVPVYVVTKDVPAGSSLADVIAASRLDEVPSRLVAPDAVKAAEDVDPELVTDAALHPGEQVLAGRFVQQHELLSADVPPGRQEVALRLDPERAVGGVIKPGSTIGVVISLDKQTVAPVQPAAADPTQAGAQATPTGGGMTRLVLQNVLVTNMQFTSPDDAAAAALIDASVVEGTPFTPTAPVIVTVALTSDEVEQVVYAAEFGAIWLTLEGDTVDTPSSSAVTGVGLETSTGTGG